MDCNFFCEKGGGSILFFAFGVIILKQTRTTWLYVLVQYILYLGCNVDILYFRLMNPDRSTTFSSLPGLTMAPLALRQHS